MPEARIRISAYKELAELVSFKELKALRTRWQDRFGKIPAPVTNLLLASEVKLAAADANISSVEIRAQRLMLTRNGEYIFVASKRFPRLKDNPSHRKTKGNTEFTEIHLTQPTFPNHLT